jgi:hypothetical protein
MIRLQLSAALCTLCACTGVDFARHPPAADSPQESLNDTRLRSGRGDSGRVELADVEDAGLRVPQVSTPPHFVVEEYWGDGGFAAQACLVGESVDAGLDAASDGDLLGTDSLSASDYDCDGVADQCPVSGDCSTSSLVASYLFEESGHDVSVHGNHVGEHNGVTYSPGVIGRGLTVNAGSTVLVPRSESFDFERELTVEVWVKLRSMPPGGGRAGLFDDDGRYGLFVLSSGEVSCVRTGAGACVGGAVAADEWTHVACVYDGRWLRVWQDGLVVAQVEAAVNTALPPGAAALVVGGNAPSGDRLDGTLDGLRIWNVARSPTQISRSVQTR